jgi:hypothetical protein
MYVKCNLDSANISVYLALWISPYPNGIGYNKVAVKKVMDIFHKNVVIFF